MHITVVEYAICKVPIFAFTKLQLLTSATFALEKTANFGSSIVAFLLKRILSLLLILVARLLHFNKLQFSNNQICRFI